MTYGKPPTLIGTAPFSLPEVMYYLYLPVFMEGAGGDSEGEILRLPPNLEICRDMIMGAGEHEQANGREWKYIYLSARKGWATPDNPLNRPGWHCDGFGTEDQNYVWWQGAGTRFALQSFKDISDDHTLSLKQFEEQIDPSFVATYEQHGVYHLDRYVVHATPLLTEGGMRQYVKVSFSNEKYNLYNNSHNYLFDYEWEMVDRENVRNDTSKAQRDFP